MDKRTRQHFTVFYMAVDNVMRQVQISARTPETAVSKFHKMTASRNFFPRVRYIQYLTDSQGHIVLQEQI